MEDLVYLGAGALSSLVMFAFAWRAAKYRARLGQQSKAVVVAGAGASMETGLDLSRLLRLADMSLQGVVSGYGCKPSREVSFSLFKQGRLNGRYSCCRLGCGGWGCAYKCVNNNGVLVVKIPHGYEALLEERSELPSVSPKLMKRFVSHAETLVRLVHPRIMRLLGYSEDYPVLAYEYTPYGSIQWQLDHGWRPGLRDKLLVVIQVGEALRYIHSRGLVHGDVKPGNVFIDGERKAKLGDFSGMVRLLQVSSTSWAGGHFTLGFRAPEQVYMDLREKARRAGVENRIDVYQLGNLLLYLLTGDVLDGEEYHRLEEALEPIGDEKLRGLLREMLSADPLKRPGIEMVLARLVEIAEPLLAPGN